MTALHFHFVFFFFFFFFSLLPVVVQSAASTASPWPARGGSTDRGRSALSSGFPLDAANSKIFPASTFPVGGNNRRPLFPNEPLNGLNFTVSVVRDQLNTKVVALSFPSLQSQEWKFPPDWEVSIAVSPERGSFCLFSFNTTLIPPPYNASTPRPQLFVLEHQPDAPSDKFTTALIIAYPLQEDAFVSLEFLHNRILLVEWSRKSSLNSVDRHQLVYFPSPDIPLPHNITTTTLDKPLPFSVREANYIAIFPLADSLVRPEAKVFYASPGGGGGGDDKISLSTFHLTFHNNHTDATTTWTREVEQKPTSFQLMYHRVADAVIVMDKTSISALHGATGAPWWTDSITSQYLTMATSFLQDPETSSFYFYLATKEVVRLMTFSSEKSLSVSWERNVAGAASLAVGLLDGPTRERERRREERKRMVSLGTRRRRWWREETDEAEIVAPFLASDPTPTPTSTSTPTPTPPKEFLFICAGPVFQVVGNDEKVYFEYQAGKRGYDCDYVSILDSHHVVYASQAGALVVLTTPRPVTPTPTPSALPTTTPSGGGSSGPLPVWAWVLIGVGGGLILLVSIYGIYYLRKKAAEESALHQRLVDH